MEEYEKLAEENLIPLHDDPELPQKLVGSFRVAVGERQDEVIHVWRFDGGNEGLETARKLINSRVNYQEYRKQRMKFLKNRENQLLIQFAHMPDPLPRKGNHVYEIRSYSLKNGAIAEWGHSWDNLGLRCRDEKTVVSGFFSNAGKLNTVLNFWCYESLKHRETARAAAWDNKDWIRHIQNTTPLISSMDSLLLEPLPFSPLQ